MWVKDVKGKLVNVNSGNVIVVVEEDMLDEHRVVLYYMTGEYHVLGKYREKYQAEMALADLAVNLNAIYMPTEGIIT
jgi:hypothetical protein